MKKLFAICYLIIAICAGTAQAAVTGTNRRGAGAATESPITAARSAVTVRTRAATTATSARAAAPRTVSARTATPIVAARAATITQKVVAPGTKVTAAAENTIVNATCREKYNGCMDTFCMIDNTSGGRCMCSDRITELNDALTKIGELDTHSYRLATEGVEKIEMGADADSTFAAANAAIDNLLNDPETTAGTENELDILSLWEPVDWDSEIEDIFAATEEDPMENQTGDALHRSASNLCVAQIPECTGDIEMLRMIYTQSIRSDCAAFENELKRMQTQSAQKLATAERAMRDAALTSLRTANRYDLGQCTLAFKECMQTTAGCGTDFTGCTGIIAAENARGGSAKQVPIKGANTQIRIAASTLDVLLSKKPMCENITNSCVAVRDQVWDGFLREAAPAVKSAELAAESDLRMNCMTTVSNCIVKACKDNINPNDPDGSYDLCLSRPDTVKNLCKVELDKCEVVDTEVWDYVEMTLAAARVDACTTQARECFTNENACGKNFENCVGLDLADIRAMCPIAKLTACNVGVTDIAQLDSIIGGIYLSVDNSMLDQCQNYVNEKMIELCGDTASCLAFEDDNVIGTEGLTSFKNAVGDTVIEGLVSFSNVNIVRTTSSDTNIKFGEYEIDINGYSKELNATTALKNRVVGALQSAGNKINQKIAILSTDPRIDMCVKGRDMQHINGRVERSTERFPHLLDSSILAIVNSGLDAASKNYTKKLNELVATATENMNDDIKTAMCAAIASNGTDVTTCTGDTSAPVCTVSNPFADLFANTAANGTTTNGIYETTMTISGAKVANLMSVASAGKSEFTIVDSLSGTMMGRESRTAVYSTADNTCTLTTTSTMCADAEAVIATSISDTYKAGGIPLIGGVKNERTITEHFAGTVCTSFSEPETKVETITM